MRITEGALRRIIREALLTEEIFGKVAFVYHGSVTPPAKFSQMLTAGEEDEFAFRPGRGAGAAYGKGLYTVYDLGRKSNTADGTYGQYIYKLGVNLDGFISFDPDAALKIYGSALTPAEQAKSLGLSSRFVKILESLQKDASGEFTSDVASKASRFLSGAVKGIIFTGREDGRVAVIYDHTTVALSSYKTSQDAGWTRIGKEDRLPFVGRMSGDWKPEKYEGNKILEYERTEEFLDRHKSGVRPSPRDLVYDGSMNLNDFRLTELPIEGLHIKGNFYPGAMMVTLPKNLRVDGHLDMFESEIEHIPSGLHVGKNLTVSRRLKSLGSGLSVGGSLYASGHEIEEIPPGTTVGEDVDLSYSQVKRLPDNFTVGGNLDLKFTRILQLPRGLKVGGNLNLRGTNVYQLPSDLEVGDRIYMEELDRSTIPAHMKGAADKQGMRKIWTRS